MLLQDTILPTGEIIRGSTVPDISAALPQMLLPGALAIGLVVAMLVLARKARQGLRAAPAQSGGDATSAALLLVLAQRERELAHAAGIGTRRRVATPSSVSANGANGANGANEPTAASASGEMYDGPVHCPACATQLGVAGPALQYVTRCPACARWIASRVEGQRVIVEARKG